MRPLKTLFLSSGILHGLAVAAVLNSTTDAFINNLLSEWGTTGGLAVAFVQKDSQGNWNVETKGYGIATSNGSQVTEHTLFAIGSNSKLFTSLATGLLIENVTLSPRLSWNSKIASLIPEWALEDPVATKQATIIDLMSHRTGMPRHDYSYKWSDDALSVIKKMKYQRPSTEFREYWQYNNNMYTTMSYLPTKLLKTPFTRYVKQHILDPLGLSSTTFSYDLARKGHLADGFTRINVNYTINPFVGTPKPFSFWAPTGGEDGNAAGGVISNAIDMATWLQMLLLDGLKPGTNTSIIPSEVVRTVATGFSVVDGELGSYPELAPSVYGGGQVASAYRGHYFVEHDGGTTGFRSIVTRLPLDNIGVSVLSNDNDYGGLINLIVKYYLLDIALGLNPVDWNTRLKEVVPFYNPGPPPARPTNANLPSVPLPSLAGVYNNKGYGSNELCYVSSKAYTPQSKTCRELNDNLSTIFPGAVEPGIPTFITKWDSPWASHLKFRHFDGNLFNVSTLLSVPSVDPQDAGKFWTYTPGFSSPAEFVINGSHIGFGLSGVWGAGISVPDLVGATPKERAEVWFDRV
ncbi:hypothetical protein H0H93_011956 [Arthromyces matolae]|nr:hypothetical protein H0H93_011956 [Arthromyces matolae]